MKFGMRKKYIRGKPMTTNYERIKNMTVEEMNLEFLSFIPTVLENVHYTGADGGYYKTAEEALEKGLQWLQSESEE